jgi:DNA (cytosine-5)-methyltransferase 1
VATSTGICPAPVDRQTSVTFMDLFAGIGAGRVGFEDACRRLDIEPVCVGFSEIDGHAAKTYLRHYPGTPALGDVRDLAGSGDVPACDVVIGGFPCQGNSRAGRRLGLKDPRSRLVFDMIEVARRANAKAFLGENVERLMSQSGGDDLRLILAAIRDAGFEPRWSVMNSRDFGVAQNRPRVYVVAFRDAVDFSFPPPTDSTKRLVDALEVQPVDVRHYLSEQYLAGIRAHRARHEAKGHGFGYRVLCPATDVAGTLVCGGMGRDGNLIIDTRIDRFPILPRRRTPISAECVRRLTPVEWERLQGMPPGWTAGQADSHRYRQLGNAMTVPVIEAISQRMLEALNGNGPDAGSPCVSRSSVGGARVPGSVAA